MPRPAKVTEDRLLDEAIAIIEEDGLDELTIGALATALGVKAPSLYNHVSGIDAIRAQVRIAAVTRLGNVLTEAAVGRAGDDALFALCHAYRAFAASNPGLYQLAVGAAAGEDDVFDRHAWNAMRPLYALLAAHGLGQPEAIHAARIIRSALHGFVSLELAGGFGLPEPVDESFGRQVDWLLDLLDKE